MRYLKKYKLFESDYLHREGRMRDDIHDILVDLEDIDLVVKTTRVSKGIQDYLEVYISRKSDAKNREIPGVVNPEGGYPGDLLFWYEIKDSIIRLTEWYYSQGRYKPIDNVSKVKATDIPLRFFCSGIEMLVGCSEEKDFEKVGDFLSFTSFRLLIRIN
jgi:hypothetical protein